MSSPLNFEHVFFLMWDKSSTTRLQRFNVILSLGMQSQPRTYSFLLAMYVTFDNVRLNQPMIIVGDLIAGDS